MTLGAYLEGPVKKVFDELEADRGISDVEADLLIRWLWKLEGLAWLISHPSGEYTEKFTLREWVLQPIDNTRREVTLAISLAAVINPKFGDAPMGLDSANEMSSIFVAGVFSRIAVMVLLRQFEREVPPQFSLYRLAALDAPDRNAKLFHPRTGFRDCVEAVNVTRDAALMLSYAHDLEVRNRAARIAAQKA